MDRGNVKNNLWLCLLLSGPVEVDNQRLPRA